MTHNVYMGNGIFSKTLWLEIELRLQVQSWLNWPMLKREKLEI